MCHLQSLPVSAAQWSEQRSETGRAILTLRSTPPELARLLAWERTERTRALRSLLRKGLITPAELRHTLSRTAVARPSLWSWHLDAWTWRRAGTTIPTRHPPVPPASAVAAAQRAQAPGATALLRGRWRLAAVKHGRSAMCRIGQGLKPPPRMPSQDRVRAWSLRGHLPHAARPSLSQAAHVAASRGFTRGS